MIGKMRERITFQEEVNIPDGAGGEDTSWQDIDVTPTVWARVAPKSANESKEAGQLVGSAIYEITVRYRADLAVANIILWNENSYNIHSIVNKDEHKKFLTIIAEQGKAV